MRIQVNALLQFLQLIVLPLALPRQYPEIDQYFFFFKESLYHGVFLASVCNILLVVSEGTNDFAMWELMLTVSCLATISEILPSFVCNTFRIHHLDSGTKVSGEVGV